MPEKEVIMDKEDVIKIEEAVKTILRAIGEDPDREGLQQTPSRVARMYDELFAGLNRDPLRPTLSSPD